MAQLPALTRGIGPGSASGMSLTIESRLVFIARGKLLVGVRRIE